MRTRRALNEFVRCWEDDDKRRAEEHGKRYPPPERTITEGMYDRLRVNPDATRLVVTRLEWQLLKGACGWGSHKDAVARDELRLLGRPVVILEDEEMSQ